MVEQIKKMKTYVLTIYKYDDIEIPVRAITEGEAKKMILDFVNIKRIEE